MKSRIRSLLLIATTSFLMVNYQNCGQGFQVSGTSNSDSSISSTNGSGNSPSGGSGNNLPSTTTTTLPPSGGNNLPPDPDDQGRRILKVCASGCPYTLPSQANAAAQDTDIIEVQNGTYNDCFTVDKSGLKFRGIGGLAHMTTKMCGGKGAIVIYGSNTVIENFEFSEMAVPDRNGAGIRHQGLGLIVRNSYFHDGENGILSGGATGMGTAADTILIENSKFEHLGGDAGHAHAVYFGNHAQVTVKNSIFFASRDQGHEFKSRAKNVSIDCSYLASLDGVDSYTLNFPDGGKVQVQNSVVEQGINSANSAVVDFGSEMATSNPVNTLSFNQVIFINDLNRGSFFNVRNSTQFTVSNSKIIGTGTVYSFQAATEQNVEKLGSRGAASYPTYPALPKPDACTDPIGLK